MIWVYHIILKTNTDTIIWNLLSLHLTHTMQSLAKSKEIDNKANELDCLCTSYHMVSQLSQIM